MRISLRKVVIVLAMLTIAMTGATVYAYADSLREPKSGLVILAYEIDHVPSYGVVITDPHPYVIEAVENPEEPIYVGGRGEETEAVYETKYVEYEGKYYVLLKLQVTVGLEPSILQGGVLGFSALGFCWVVVGYAYHRKKEKRDER